MECLNLKYQPHIAAYTYDAGGERSIRYVPRQQEGVSSGATSGYAQDMDIMLYPNALITVRPQELTDEFNFREFRPEYTFTTYTKHYYIGSERISSKLGTRKDLGILCEEMGGNDLIDEMNQRVEEAGERLEDLHTDLDKDLRLNSPYPYSPEHQFVCGFKSHNPELYDAYWYHPDHLGSSSFITNTTGEISQHMEYLPFGETFVEEHLNSYNSPFKFNGKEYDAETGNYYYGARYMNPKWSMWLGVDPLAEKYPGISPYAYVANNPINAIDPDGMRIEPVYDTDGNHIGNTEEGFTGQVLIYSGNEEIDFSTMSAEEAMDIDGVTTYDAQRNSLSGDAKSNIWTHIVSQMEGVQIYDEIFRMGDLEGGKIHFDNSINAGWLATYRRGTGKGKITGTDKYRYETTVENLQSSIGVHEYYSHIKKNQGSRTYSSHRLAYKNVINFKSLWNNTTDHYKGFNMQRLRDYTERETGRKTVDPLYQNLFDKYSKYSR